MKVRRGFVSNSSSSSFITDFSNVEDCLIYMLDNYLQNSSDDYRTEKVRLILENFKILSNNYNSKDCPVAFHSCNFDTFIKKIEINNKNYIYVATCNNEDWDLSTSLDIFPMNNDTELGIEYPPDNLIHGGDIYEGIFDDRYVRNNIFYVIDDERKICKIKVGKTLCFGISKSTIIEEE